MSMTHHGEISADKAYTIETLSQALGFSDTRTVRGYFDKGLKRCKVGMKTYIAGSHFVRWIEERSVAVDGAEDLTRPPTDAAGHISGVSE